MIKAIEIGNFRCFEHLRIDGCRRINVIVGDNGTGKTALLEAIFFALAASPSIGLRYRQQRGLDGSFSGTPRQIEEALWKDLFFEGHWERPIQIELTGDGPEARSITIYRGRSQSTIPLLADAQEEERRTSPVVFQWRDAAGKMHVSEPKIGPQGLEVIDSDEDLPDFFFFGAQTIGSSENAGRFSELRRAGRGDAFIKTITQEYPWIEGLDIEVIAGLPVIYAKLSHQKRVLPLANVSAGISRALGVMLAVASRDRSAVLVDELESGLFHTHHEPLWRALLALIRTYESQLFTTTHSDEWLKALLRAADDKVDDIALWRLERGGGGPPALYQFDGDTLKDAIEFGAEARGK
jgi:hypothetical protein